jgi:hypothetical protein
MNENYTEIIQAAARLISDTALNLLECDTHQFQARPCSTCQAISNLFGRPFGCELKQIRRIE